MKIMGLRHTVTAIILMVEREVGIETTLQAIGSFIASNQMTVISLDVTRQIPVEVVAQMEPSTEATTANQRMR